VRPRLLIVDDDADVREVVELVLLDTGWEIDSVGGGADAVAVCGRAVVDGVLLDLEMPGMNGRETLARLRGEPGTAGLPVVFLTATAEPGLAAELGALGATAVFGKPFDPLRLGDRLAAAFGWLTTTDGPPQDRCVAG